MNEPTLSDLDWLTGDAAATLLTDTANDSRPLLAQLESLRKAVSNARAHLVLEQVELRRRARAKYHLAARLFFDRVALEQSTDEVTAAYKATRFPTGQLVADLCCGIGGDLLALATRGETIGIERNEGLALLAAANARVARHWMEIESKDSERGGASTPLPGAATIQASDLQAFDIASVAAWHIDPDRRPQGRRTTQVELHEPSAEVWSRLCQQNPRACIKLSPAAELPSAWEQAAELEWISRGGSCRQLAVWRGDLTTLHGQRRATVLGDSPESSRAVQGLPTGFPLQPRPGRYLFEPDAAILAAELVGPLAAELELAALIPGGGYLTGDVPLSDAALATFETLEVLPFQLKPLKNLLRERRVGRLEVKKRGVDHDPEKLRRELKTPGDEAATLIVTRLPAGVTAILARRITAR